jgi:hypothetical protein
LAAIQTKTLLYNISPTLPILREKIMTKTSAINVTSIIVLASTLIFSLPATSAQTPSINPNAQRVIDHWTKARVASAIPRDLVIDERGLGYLRRRDGSLQPYGHNIPAQLRSSRPTPLAKPPGAGGGGSSNDSTAPTISNMAPSAGAVIGANQAFSATVTDDLSGVKSVTFIITYPDGVTTQSFSPSFVGNDTWETTISGFSDGNWSWQVVAKDNAKKGGNTASSDSINFTVDTGDTSGGGSGGGGSSYIVTNAGWSAGGAIQTAAGRLYFEMPGNAKRKGPWSGYVCSGTVVTDSASGRSLIMTASHCVYDDSNKAFARNVLFIPDQDGTTAAGTDLNCSNDPLGCWVPSFGVVDVNWTTRSFPDNVAWDYAYYVVNDNGAHQGSAASSNSLDSAAGSLPVSFTAPYYDDGDPSATSVDFTYALGYSYSDDPNFMYCAEDMTIKSDVNWWLASCGLTGGSSGGPWVQPMDTSTGSGPLISVNSWGYTNQPGMAGPMLSGNSAQCIFTEAQGINFAAVSSSDGDAGVAIDYCP